MKILVTGGPVHAYLDAVKLITNRFRGGLMAELAEELSQRNFIQVTYLTTKDSKVPDLGETVVYHDGLYDYMDKVLELAPHMDAVILGAAVANLIPLETIKGKFPSHNYKVGDVIPINFTIAPRIIDKVKEAAPNTHLFGFKLLAGVSHDELIHAAYETLLWSKATAVFANQTNDLKQKFIVTKERGVHLAKMEKHLSLDDTENISLSQFIIDCIGDEYYKTSDSTVAYAISTPEDEFEKLVEKYRDEFVLVPEGYMFGTIAVRGPLKTFLTTGRGKNELSSRSVVVRVDHENHIVHTLKDKSTLNAPLLDWIFRNNDQVKSIVHLHRQYDGLPVLPYAPPGTVRDSQRHITSSFNIAGHGCFLLLDEKGLML